MRREIEFQNSIYPQNLEDAQLAQKRTLAAKATDGQTLACTNVLGFTSGPMQCFIGSQASMAENEKYNDDQVEKVMQCALQGKKFLMHKGIHTCVDEALKDIGKIQKQRVLDRINARAKHSAKEQIRCEAEDVEELIEELENDKGMITNTHGGSPSGKRSLADFTTPRPHQPTNYNHPRRRR